MTLRRSMDAEETRFPLPRWLLTACGCSLAVVGCGMADSTFHVSLTSSGGQASAGNGPSQGTGSGGSFRTTGGVSSIGGTSARSGNGGSMPGGHGGNTEVRGGSPGTGGTLGTGSFAGSSGGAAVAGAAGAGGADDEEGGAGGTSGGPTLGDPCVGPGSLSCNGSNKQEPIICTGGVWTARPLCTTGQNCDQSSGVCLPIVAECLSRAPKERFCSANDVSQRCGPDRVSITTQNCAGLCRGGACQAPYCGDGKLEAPEECDDGNALAGDGCEPTCVQSRVEALAAGADHTCALLRGGFVRCWGRNDAGQLGVGNSDDASAKHPYQNPVVPLGVVVQAIATGGQHTCALSTAGDVLCWGDNSSGQLGLGHTKNIGDDEVPNAKVAQVALGKKARAIAAGGAVTCVALVDGTVRCWGVNGFGQLGLGHLQTVGDDEIPSTQVAQVSLGNTTRALATDGESSCAVLDNNQIRCWGRNDLGQLGLGTTDTIGDNELPSDGPAIELPKEGDGGYEGKILGISMGGGRGFIWSDKGIARDWGDNRLGTLGYGIITPMPRAVTAWGPFWRTPAIVQMSGGQGHACLRVDHDLRCWGLNEHGQLGLATLEPLGDGTGIQVVPPIDLGNNSDGSKAFATQASAGRYHSCALLDQGHVRCWGDNSRGQLGLGFVSPYEGGDEAHLPNQLALLRILP